jgi:hypothetical protein
MTPTEVIPGARWNISAVVESDADGDGYGDVTQDACPESAKTQVTCPVPNTKIKKAPPKLSADRSVLVKFTSTVKKSKFKCSLDGGKYRKCTSPYRRTLAVGQHVLRIRATSPVGVKEVKPAKVRFRILAKN